MTTNSVSALSVITYENRPVEILKKTFTDSSCIKKIAIYTALGALTGWVIAVTVLPSAPALLVAGTPCLAGTFLGSRAAYRYKKAEIIKPKLITKKTIEAQIMQLIRLKNSKGAIICIISNRLIIYPGRFRQCSNPRHIFDIYAMVDPFYAEKREKKITCKKCKEGLESGVKSIVFVSLAANRIQQIIKEIFDVYKKGTNSKNENDALTKFSQRCKGYAETGYSNMPTELRERRSIVAIKKKFETL